MKTAGKVAVLSTAVLCLTACIDDTAGPVAYTGKPALRVGLDIVAQMQIPGGPVAGKIDGTDTDSLSLTLQYLAPLSGNNRYQVWLANDTAAARIGVRHTTLRPDTVGFDEFDGTPIIEWREVAPESPATEFNATTGYRQVLRFTRGELTAAGVDMSAYTHVVVTIGSGDANPLTSPAPVFFRYAGLGTGAFTDGVAQFGFDPAAASGTGWVAFGGGSVEWLNVEGFGLLAQRIARPPRGFFYELWLVDEGRTRKVRLGELLTPAPEFASLMNADVEEGPFVARGEIIKAGRYVRWADLQATPDQFSALLIALKPKAGVADELPETVVYQAAVPPNLDQLPKFTDGFREKLGK
ncbi:MAG TPA: hypothetical protein VIL18_04680 [Longimicrobiales bacterium]